MKIKIITFLFLVNLNFVFADALSSYEAGKKFQDLGEWYQAIENYQETIKLNPSYALAYKGLAESFYALNEYNEVLEQVIKAEKYRKNDPDLLNLRAFSQIGLGQLPEAKKNFEYILSSWPNDVNARFGLAEIEIALGKNSSATSLYQDALQRNPENRKALLSLALLTYEAGNVVASRDFISRALKFHGDNPQVFYFSAYLSYLQGLTGEAENRLRTAIFLRPNYEQALNLLSSIFLQTKRYSELLTICENRISQNRNNAHAWYLKALSLEKTGKMQEAITAAQVGLDIQPEDELLRLYTENLILTFLPLEDSSRNKIALWHYIKGKKFEEKNYGDQALYEYKRALSLDPYDTDTRLAYAKLLLNKGYPYRYLEQLEFIQSLGKGTLSINDSVESYKKILQSSLPSVWNIRPLYLDKAHISIGLYYFQDTNLIHPDSNRLITGLLKDVFDTDQRFAVSEQNALINSYAEAFKKSREKNEDFFGLVSFNETERDVEIVLDLYVSKTGSKAESFSVFRTGNDRLSNAARKLVQNLTTTIPVSSSIISRYQNSLVIDFGKTDQIKVGDVFSIIPSNKITYKNSGIGFEYSQNDVLGTVTINTVSDDISQGSMTKIGFFDRVAVGDRLIIAQPKKNEDVPNLTETPVQNRQNALLLLLRSIL